MTTESVEVDANGDGHVMVTDKSGAIMANAELERGISDALEEARNSIDHLSLRLLGGWCLVGCSGS